MEISSIKLRFMQPSEVTRVGELMRALQDLQKMQICKRIPDDDDMMHELLHRDVLTGQILPNKFGTFTVVAVDSSKMKDSENYDYIVGYIVYSQFFSIIHGRHFFMNSFFIQNEYRRYGLGTKFIKFMRIHALATGNKTVDVPFMIDNLIGQKFYSRYGSKMVSEEYYLMSLKVDEEGGH